MKQRNNRKGVDKTEIHDNVQPDNTADSCMKDSDNMVEKDQSNTDAAKLTDEINALRTEIDNLNDVHLRLRAEFDNFRRRTLEEKRELLLNGGEKVLIGLLPIIDDMQRAVKTLEDVSDLASIKEGMSLIYNKLLSFLTSQGVSPIETKGVVFDTDRLEAVATIPAPDEESKGKVCECVQTGYILNEKVIRHAKVVVWQ